MLRGRKSKGSAFGLALVAMLVFGAFAASAAQASPVWHVNGKTLKEAGLSNYNVFVSGGKFTFDFWEVTIGCDAHIGAGDISGESSGTMWIEANNCKVNNAPNCYVKPMKFTNLHLGLGEGGSTGVIETFTPGYLPTLVISGPLCSLNEFEEEFNYVAGSLAAEVAQAGRNLSLTGLPAQTIDAAFGEEVAEISFSGVATQETWSGAALGVW